MHGKTVADFKFDAYSKENITKQLKEDEKLDKDRKDHVIGEFAEKHRRLTITKERNDSLLSGMKEGKLGV